MILTLIAHLREKVGKLEGSAIVITFASSAALFWDSVLPFFLAAEFHRFFTAFSDLPGSNFAIFVQLHCVHTRSRRQQRDSLKISIVFHALALLRWKYGEKSKRSRARGTARSPS